MQQQAVHQARDEADHLRRQNEAVVSEAEARLQRLAQDRDLLTQQAEQAEQHAARLRDELQILKRQGTSVHTPSFVETGSVRNFNPSDTPTPPAVASNPATQLLVVVDPQVWLVRPPWKWVTVECVGPKMQRVDLLVGDAIVLWMRQLMARLSYTEMR